MRLWEGCKEGERERMRKRGMRSREGARESMCGCVQKKMGEEASREGCQKGHHRKKGGEGGMIESSVLDFLACAAVGGIAGSWPER